MYEIVYQNLWDIPAGDPPHILCITTNFDVNRYGEAVMGRGVARECATRYPDAKREFSRQLLQGVRCPKTIGQHNGNLLVSFPVKYHWHEKANLGLIKNSAEALIKRLSDLSETGTHFGNIYLPKPGCGNGKLNWETEVEPIFKQIKGMYHIVDFPHNRKEQPR